MSGLQQRAITTAGDHKVGFQIPQVGKAPIEVSLRRECFNPLLLHAFAVEDRLERGARLFRVPFGPVDDDDDFADFHGFN